MQIVHFERQFVPGQHSVERVFAAVRRALTSECQVRVVNFPTPHHSHWWLVQGIARAWARKGEVNHIVGDVHYTALGVPGARCILTIHDLHRLDRLRGLRGALYRWLYFRIPLGRCAIITTISEKTRDTILEIFPFAAGRIVVIPDPVPDGFEHRPKPFYANYPRILQVGTAPHKNVSRLVQAIQGLPCKLHIIGQLDDEQRRLLEQGHVDCENSVNMSDAEMLQAYDQADIVVFVSLAEGFGMPIIEAQAMGRPVLTSNLSPMKEVAGVGALTVDPYDVRAIRSAIRQIVDDGTVRHRATAAGLENAKRFTAKTVADQYARLYQRVAAGGCHYTR